MDLEVLKKRIRAQREKCRLTQAQPANSLMISPQAVSKRERGDNTPDISILRSLSMVPGISVDWILGGDEARTDPFEASVLCTSLRTFAAGSAGMDTQAEAIRTYTLNNVRASLKIFDSIGIDTRLS